MVGQRLEIAITGVGAVSGYGEGAEALWRGLCGGKDALSPIERFPCGSMASPLAGVVGRWPGELSPSDDERFRDLCVRFALSAAREALASARMDWPFAAADRVALVVGTSTQKDDQGLDRQSARMAAELGVRGPCVAVGTVCCASTNALGLGRDLLEAGSADVVIAGGADAISPELAAGFHALGLLSKERCAPFSDRAGTTLGEGAGFVILETRERAERRGAVPLAWLCGYGLSGDAFHETAPDPSGAGVARAVRAALADSGVAAEQVGYVNAHGTGTQANDAAEVRGLQAALGKRAAEIPVSSTKGHLGHAQGAAGALELIATLLAAREGTVPPTLHLDRARRGAPVDPVGQAAPRRHAWEVAISTNSAMAGSNAAAVVSRHPVRRARPSPRPISAVGVGLAGGDSPGGPRDVTGSAADGEAARELRRDGASSARGGEGARELRHDATSSAHGAISRSADADISDATLARLLPTADVSGMDPSARLLALAAARALEDARLKISADRRDRSGLVLGNSRLSPATIRAFRASIAERGLWRLATSSFARRMPSAPAGACATALDLRGPGTTIATGEGESLCAVAFAAQLLSGRSPGDLLLAGGVRETENEAEALALVAGGDGAVTLAGWALAGPGQEAAALEQALARAGRRRSDLQ
ncbi:MAG TPA: beta-ketoacyl-[acyl-carrier-protein] synthase family protein, partial [Myxococcales bacterium]|nr:beta-ketoacyl-[acyl-carrier-protein] synthase family protein [Myxococcales bacterium]